MRPLLVRSSRARAFAALALALALGPALACSSPSGASSGSRPPPQPTVAPRTAVPTSAPTTSKQWLNPPEMTIDPAREYTAVIKTTEGDITVELLPQEAPRTVNNFVFLAREGFYDNVKFHRVIKNFMIQTGDPQGTGAGGPGYRFADEPVQRDYTPGILAMANAGPNTNGSQFFIMHGDASGKLAKNYTIFGRVIDGMDVVDKIANVPTRANPQGEQSVPTRDVRIESVTIDESEG